jgi:membrane-associated protease RseP (regulator of RpoE activity)
MQFIIMLLLISILIIAHELGHFWVAKRCGVRVERFGFGLPFGPTLWSKKIGETEYCVHAALFGGYVAFPDDTPDSPIPADSKERFENQPLWNRFAIAVAGVTVNAILGWAIMVFVIMGWGLPNGDISVQKLIAPDVPAAVAGIQSGDVIAGYDTNKTLVDDRPLDVRWGELQTYIQNNPEKPIQLTVLRSGEEIRIQVTPTAEGTIGFQFAPLRKYEPQHNIFIASGQSAQFLGNFVVENFKAMGRMFTDFDPKQLGGPVQIVKTGGDMIDSGGIQDGLILTAIVSIILAVMNLLPIPALDGGHILFIVIEALKGSPLKKEVQERFVQAGFLVLMGLMVFVLWNDLNNLLFNGGSLPTETPAPQAQPAEPAPQPAGGTP